MKKIIFPLFLGLSSLYASSLVVYNSNIGLVHQERNFTLKKGDKNIIYKDVASSIITDSINLKLPKGVELYSQQYRYDKLTLSKLLKYNIGKKVLIKHEYYTLLSANSNELILKDKNSKIVIRNTKDISFDKIPSQLLSKPSLIWNVKTSKDIKGKLELDYLIKNIKWNANYVLDIDHNHAKLRGFITIVNNSGKSFNNTTLYTLAGDINRITHNNRHMVYAKMMVADAPAIKESAHEGYHIYKIPFKVTLRDKEKTQISFLNYTDLNIKRSYETRMNNPIYLHSEKNKNVSQYIELQKIDTPLPKGSIRIYSKLNNTAILLGINRIDHTPKNKQLKLRLGTNFDIKAKETIVKRSDTEEFYNIDVKYTLYNSSNEQKIIKIKIPFNQNRYSIIKSTQKYRFTKGNLATFNIKIKANSTKSFNVHFESKR